MSQPAPPVGRVVEHRLDHLPVPATLRLYYPEGSGDAPLPLYLHLHGGGFAHGDLDSLDRWKREIAADAGIVTAGLSYALSPEARYPVALEQVLGALRWLRDQAPSLGLDASRLSVGGESAGGNLTVISPWPRCNACATRATPSSRPASSSTACSPPAATRPRTTLMATDALACPRKSSIGTGGSTLPTPRS
ncbi:Acetyl esterase [compost metagenome]